MSTLKTARARGMGGGIGMMRVGQILPEKIIRELKAFAVRRAIEQVKIRGKEYGVVVLPLTPPWMLWAATALKEGKLRKPPRTAKWRRIERAFAPSPVYLIPRRANNG